MAVFVVRSKPASEIVTIVRCIESTKRCLIS
jgi:hypothetical protein